MTIWLTTRLSIDIGNLTPDNRSVQKPAISDTQAFFRFILFSFV